MLEKATFPQQGREGSSRLGGQQRLNDGGSVGRAHRVAEHRAAPGAQRLPELRGRGAEAREGEKEGLAVPTSSITCG